MSNINRSRWEKNFFRPIVIDDRCVIHSTFHKELPFLSGSGIYFLLGLILIPAVYLACSFVERYAIFSPRGVDGLFFALPCLFWFAYHLVVSFEGYQGELPFLLVIKIIGCRIVFYIIIYIMELWTRVD